MTFHRSASAAGPNHTDPNFNSILEQVVGTLYEHPQGEDQDDDDTTLDHDKETKEDDDDTAVTPVDHEQQDQQKRTN